MKLVKLVVSIAYGLGIASSIPFTTTSCSESTSEKINPLPESVYDIDQNNVLKGFNSEFLVNPSAYSEYDAIKIPARVTSINTFAFYHNFVSTIPSFIKNLTFAKGSHCYSIGQDAFTKSSLTSVTLSSSLNEILTYAFQECSSLISIDFSAAKNLSIIYSYAFQNCSKLTSIVFPDNLSSIGEYAFSGCSCLNSVTFPSNLTKIDNNVFDNCTSLNRITWNSWNGDTTLYPTSFSGVCPDDGTVEVINQINEHDSTELLKYLKDHGGLPQTWSVSLPESVYDIEDNVLMGFKDDFLNNPDSEIYQDNFKDCDTMLIPTRVTNVHFNAFYKGRSECTTIPSFITNLRFPNNSNCSSISNSAFRNCSSLTSITFPSSLTTISSYAFYACSSLTSVDFSKCTSLSTINEGAFEKCSELHSLNLSNCNVLKIISSYAFNSCSTLASVTFPSSLSAIGDKAFGDCVFLNNITWNSWKGTLTALYENSFTGLPTYGNVCVTNPINGHDSDELLDYLKTKGIPENWEVPN